MINDLVLAWADDRGILDQGTVEGQINKLQEELNELIDAYSKGDQDELADAIGDMQVVLIIIAEMKGLCAHECLSDAYDVINRRKGKMIDGVFVKEEAV